MLSVCILWSIHQSFINHPWMVMSVWVLIIQYWSIFMWKHPTMPGRQSLSSCVGQLQDESQSKGPAQNVPACRLKQAESNRPMQQLMHHPSSFIITECSSAHSVKSRLGQIEKCQVCWEIRAKALFKVPPNVKVDLKSKICTDILLACFGSTCPLIEPANQ